MSQTEKMGSRPFGRSLKLYHNLLTSGVAVEVVVVVDTVVVGTSLTNRFSAKTRQEKPVAVSLALLRNLATILKNTSKGQYQFLCHIANTFSAIGWPLFYQSGHRQKLVASRAVYGSLICQKKFQLSRSSNLVSRSF